MPAPALHLAASGLLTGQGYDDAAARLSSALLQRGMAVVEPGPAAAAVASQSAAALAGWLVALGPEERSELDIDQLADAEERRRGGVFNEGSASGSSVLSIRLHPAHSLLHGLPPGVEALTMEVGLWGRACVGMLECRRLCSQHGCSPSINEW